MILLAFVFGSMGVVGLCIGEGIAGLLSLAWAGLCLYAAHRSKIQNSRSDSES